MAPDNPLSLMVEAESGSSNLATGVSRGLDQVREPAAKAADL
jgi:hypothetical protein